LQRPFGQSFDCFAQTQQLTLIKGIQPDERAGMRPVGDEFELHALTVPYFGCYNDVLAAT
jgi:hypothetical protein